MRSVACLANPEVKNKDRYDNLNRNHEIYVLMILWHDDKHTRIAILLLEPEFITVSHLLALASRVSLRCLVNSNFYIFCEVFVKFFTVFANRAITS